MSTQAVNAMPTSQYHTGQMRSLDKDANLYTAPATAGNLGAELKPAGNAAAQVKVRLSAPLRR